MQFDRPVLPDDSIALGEHAAEMAARALEDGGRKLIRQKSLDIARQIEIYLSHCDHCSLETIRNDSELRSIAVVRIGETGYSAVHDSNALNWFHCNPAIVGTHLSLLKSVSTEFWDIIERSLTHESDGYYDWPELDGQLHRKYMYCARITPAQIAPLGLIVATTISIDEFLQPSRDISQKIRDLTLRVDRFTQIELRRNSLLRSVNEVSRRISAFLNVDDLLPYVARALQTTFQLQAVRIYLVAEEYGLTEPAAQSGELPCLDDSPNASDLLAQSIVAEVANTGKPYLSRDRLGGLTSTADDIQNRPCEPVRIVVPIKIGKTILGVLDLIDKDAEHFDEIDLFSIWPLADQIAIALENARLHRDLREMAVIEERNHIAREIHDTLAQGFAGISMLAETAKMSLREDDYVHVYSTLERIRSLAREKLQEARRSAQALRPDATLSEPLEALIRSELQTFSTDMNVEVAFRVVGNGQPIPADSKLALLRICQEALNNIRKHAYASQVEVALTYTPMAISLFVRDDGMGFSPQTPVSNTFGLTSMSERARLVGGSVIVQSEIGKGTRVFVTVPL